MSFKVLLIDLRFDLAVVLRGEKVMRVYCNCQIKR